MCLLGSGRLLLFYSLIRNPEALGSCRRQQVRGIHTHETMNYQSAVMCEMAAYPAIDPFRKVNPPAFALQF